ncbi:hypothetical protein ACFWFZ_14740 [Streptomyces sp. NPDC060232]|uniref:hypothetical protein n=1 Tax=Streptomyces sp. NPDC060232 TaxID=3347079 RepID=UPI00365E5A06
MLSVLFGLLLLLYLAFGQWVGESSPPLTEKDVVGTWHGDRGARLEVMADGRARLSDTSGWKCAGGGEPGEGSWTLDQLPDEDPGIRVRFSPDGTPAAQGCNDWFTLHGTGTEGAAGGGSEVWATFLSSAGGGAERFRRTATG